MPVADQRAVRSFTLLWRELLEYRNSLLWTPLFMVAGLAAVMLVSVLLAQHISAVGESIQQLVVQPEDTHVSIRIEDRGGDKPAVEYRIEQRQGPGAGMVPGAAAVAGGNQAPAIPGRLNPLLNGVHNLFLFVLILVCANYLLATLFTDRRDRSILFWKSMPVSEWDEVLSKFAVAMLVAPMLFIAASLLAQAACVVLSMLLVWRMEMDPYRLIPANLDFSALLLGQLGGWLLMTLWIAPAYAWLLLASAASRRSPFMTAAAPVIGLLLLERILFGTHYLVAWLSRHVPHYGGGSSAGFYWLGWEDLPQILLGLVFACAALWLAVYLRRYRFEL